jgi:hypothetical protein
METPPPIPADLWEQVPPAAREAVEALARRHQEQVQAYQAAVAARSAGWPVPSAPHEVLAAVRAGERSWRQFPYYALRYGDRGKTFTSRDSLWLAGLTGLAENELYAQIGWLGWILAARGMPRWLLERHLEVLHEELVRLAPAGSEPYAGLLRAAGRLRAERERWVGDALLEELAEGFAVRVGSEELARLPEAGRLLAAAVADERCGSEQAVPSLKGWLADPSQFSEAWVKAVRATLQDARDRAAVPSRPKDS